MDVPCTEWSIMYGFIMGGIRNTQERTFVVEKCSTPFHGGSSDFRSVPPTNIARRTIVDSQLLFISTEEYPVPRSLAPDGSAEVHYIMLTVETLVCGQR